MCSYPHWLPSRTIWADSGIQSYQPSQSLALGLLTVLSRQVELLQLVAGLVVKSLLIHLKFPTVLTRNSGVIYPIVFYRLQPRIGFGWATRVIGFIALATLFFSVSVMKPKSLPPAARQFFDLGAIKNVLFNLTNLGTFFLFTGLYIPLFYVCWSTSDDRVID